MSSRVGEKTEFGPGKTALYYNNKGLFSDPFLEDRLPNLEKYYNSPSTRFLNDFWNIDESEAVKFNEAFQRVMDLWVELDKDIPKFCKKERQLQNTWIDKIFGFLGWTYELEETSSKNGVTNFPDYALFATKEDWKKSKDLEGNYKFKKATAVADAKDWGISLDGKGFSNKNPSFQIINYLKQTDKDWGVLTDGKYWRIYSLRSDSKHTTFYEIDLEKILATGDQQRFKYFYNFFRVEAFVKDAKLSDRSFLDFVFEDGQVYSQRVEDDLKARAFEVVESISKGFCANKSDLSEVELKEVYDHSLFYLFKLLFVLNCESKGLLEVNKQDAYYNQGALRKKCIEIKEQWEANTTWSNQPRTYNYIQDLFNLLEQGDSSIGVHGFGNEVFSSGNPNFYKKNSISDKHLNLALLELATKEQSESSERLFIDYKILSPDHIGSLFEGLLEYKLKYIDGALSLVNDKGERKKTASYYTPDYIVNFMVDDSLAKIVKGKKSQDILKIKVCDPAMGSGHFLLGALKYLEEKVQEFQNENPEASDNLNFDSIKKQILHNCLFGVDKNTLAVELAKFSLWIYTAEKGEFLEPLSDQFKLGNSLIDAHPDKSKSFVWSNEFKDVFDNGGFDAVVGNPPYLGEKGNKDIFRDIREYGVLGKDTYMRKMDIFYWFIMKGIELVKDDGTVSYITTNYWPTADGADNLKAYMIKNGAMTKYIDFLGATIFKDAKGQSNSIICYQKGLSWNRQNLSIYRATEKFEEESLKWDRALAISEKKYFSNQTAKLMDVCPAKNQWTISQKNSSSPVSSVETNIVRENYRMFFGKNAISRGIETGSDKVSEALIKLAIEKEIISEGEKSKYKKGQGIFVVSQKEIAEKEIERELLLNWYKNSSIGYYIIDDTNTDKLIYVDSKIDIRKYPKAKNHLTKFRPLLAAREQANNDDDNWYWIRGPKRDKIYNKVTIVCPYRAKVPKFSLSNKKVYGAGDMYFVIDFFDCSPEVMLGYLNSAFVAEWMAVYGKKKGDLFELYQSPLSEIPVPDFSAKAKSVLQDKVDRIHSEIKDLIKLTKDESKIKDVMDLISENRKTAFESVKAKYNTENVLLFAKKIISLLADIDSVVFDEMLNNSKKRAG